MTKSINTVYGQVFIVMNGNQVVSTHTDYFSATDALKDEMERAVMPNAFNSFEEYDRFFNDCEKACKSIKIVTSVISNHKEDCDELPDDDEISNALINSFPEPC